MSDGCIIRKYECLGVKCKILDDILIVIVSQMFYIYFFKADFEKAEVKAEVVLAQWKKWGEHRIILV